MVIEKFAEKYAPFEALQSGNYPQLVAGRIVPLTEPFIAPVTGRRCVFYSVKAEELVHKTRKVKDKKGRKHTEHYTQWTYRYTDKKSSDFLLIDPGNPTIYIYVPFTQCKHKVHSEKDGHAKSFPKGTQYTSQLDVSSSFADCEDLVYIVVGNEKSLSIQSSGGVAIH